MVRVWAAVGAPGRRNRGNLSRKKCREEFGGMKQVLGSDRPALLWPHVRLRQISSLVFFPLCPHLDKEKIMRECLGGLV